jgi:hypothetical protein
MDERVRKGFHDGGWMLSLPLSLVLDARVMLVVSIRYRITRSRILSVHDSTMRPRRGCCSAHTIPGYTVPATPPWHKDTLHSQAGEILSATLRYIRHD